MGVKDLWAIVAPAMVPVPLADLKGQTLAVDLSIWIVETQGVRQMQGVVTKPYLRNLFFRINHLLQLGINLIFVIEGEAPKLKWETMAQRTQVRYGGAGRGRGNAATQKPPTRSHFNAIIKECCHLLDAIGVPYVQSTGEAEAKCAFLNAKGVVDGCLTDDGDVFLYGARKVYRNFTMKDPHIESYDMADIKEKLAMERSHMVALGLLLGCDYIPKGVPGVGREMALKFFKQIGKENVLERFDIWVKNKKHYAQLEATSSAKKPTHCSQCKHPGSAREHDRHGCTLCHSSEHCEPQPYDYVCPCNWHSKQQEVSASAVELNIQKRAIRTNGFPWPKVVEEFMTPKDKVPRNRLSWHCPKLNPFIRFCETKMEWVEDYSREKLLPLMTLWGMRAQLGIYCSNGKQYLEPHCIVKPRVRLGVPCFEVQWQKLSEDCTFKEDYYTTIEEADIFRQCFPETVVLFEARKPVKTKRKAAKTKDEVSDKENVDVDDVTTAISDLKLSDEKSFGRSTAEQKRDRKGEERCVLGSEEKTTIQPDEICKGNKVPVTANEGQNKVSQPPHEQKMAWKEVTLSEPRNPLYSRHLDMHKMDDEMHTQQSSLYHQNCSGSTRNRIGIEKPKTSDLKSSAESSSDDEEYLPLSQRLALLPKVNKKPIDAKTIQTSFVYRVNQRSTAVKVSQKPGIDVNQMPVKYPESPTTDRAADVASDTPHNGTCGKSNVSDEAIENKPELEQVFEDTKTGESPTLMNEDCSFRNVSMQVPISMPHVQVVKDQPSESELVSLLKECSLQGTAAVLDEDTTDKVAMPPSSSQGIDITSSPDCKNPDEIVKAKDESGGMPFAKDTGGAVNARECLGKRSVAAGGRKKLTKGKVRKSSKPWYTESVLDFSSDDDLVFDLHGDDHNVRGRIQTSSQPDLQNNRGTLTDDAEMILEEKFISIKDSTLDMINNMEDFNDTESVMSSHPNTDTESITEEDGNSCKTKRKVTTMEAPEILVEEDESDTSVSGQLEQSVEKGTCSFLEGGFIREDTINLTDGLDDSSNLAELAGGFIRERTGSLFREIGTNGSDEAKETLEEQAAIEEDIGPSIYEETPSDSRCNSYISNSVQDTSFELSVTEPFENSSKNDHECDVTSSVKNYSVDSFLNQTPTVVFIDTPLSSPLAEVPTVMKSLHKIVESPKFKTSGMEGPVSTTAANNHVSWNKSQFGNFSMGCTLLDITCGSDKPDTSRYAADTHTVFPVENIIYEANVQSDLGSADQSLSPSTLSGGPSATNSAPCGTTSPLTAYSLLHDAMSPLTANSAPCDVISSPAGDNVGVQCGAMSPCTANSGISGTVSPVATNSALYDLLSSITANSALTNVTCPGSPYDAIVSASSGSALFDPTLPATATIALSDAIAPATAKNTLSDAKLPIMATSPHDTSVFAAASPIPLAQRLMKRVGSHLLTQFSQPSQSLRTLSQPLAQQSPQYSNTQALKSKSIDFDDSDITLLDTK